MACWPSGCPSLTMVSIAHKPSVVAFHDRRVVLDPERRRVIVTSTGARRRPSRTASSGKKNGISKLAASQVMMLSGRPILTKSANL